MVLEIEHSSRLVIPHDIFLHEEYPVTDIDSRYRDVMVDVQNLPDGLGYKALLQEYKNKEKPHYVCDLKRGISHARFAIEMLEILEDEEIRDKMLKEKENDESPKSIVLSAVANEIMGHHIRSNELSEGEDINQKKPLLSVHVLESILQEELREDEDNGREILDKPQIVSREGHREAFKDGFNLVIRIVGNSRNILSNKQTLVFYSDA